MQKSEVRSAPVQQKYSIEELVTEGIIAEQQSAAQFAESEYQKNPFIPISLEDLLEMPPKKYLVEQLFGYEDNCMMVGDSGTGKSFQAIDLAVRGALGLDIAGRYKCARPFATLYCTEEGVSGIPQRFKAACEHHGLLPGSEEAKNIAFINLVPKLFHDESSAEGIDNFVHAVKDLEARTGVHFDLIILDTLNDVAEGSNENDNGHISTINLRLRKLREALKTTTCFLHHTPKHGSGPRGGTGHKAKCDLLIEVSRDGERRKFECKKAKDSQEFGGQNWDLVQKDVSAIVKWGCTPQQVAQVKQDKYSEVVAILRNDRDSGGSGLRAEDVHSLLKVQPVLRTVQTYLRTMSEDPLIGITGVRRQIQDKDGKLNNYAWFYYMEKDSSSG